MTKHISDYGSWPSTIDSELLTRDHCRLSEPQLSRANSFWLESRPEEKGRGVLVCRREDGYTFDTTPVNMSVRTRIHEYGGGSYCIHQHTVYFVNDSDQRIYQLNIESGAPPIAISPEGNYRYGDFCIDEKRQQLIGVCEIHEIGNKEPENCIIATPLNDLPIDRFNVLVSGNDFYSNPSISPDGKFLSWLTWNHPNMPWDNSACWLAEFETESSLKKHHKVAGGSAHGSRNESIFQPQWSPAGELYFVSDYHLWWNLYRYNIQNGTIEAITELEAEFATPQWLFGMSTYGFLDRHSLFCCYTQEAQWQAAIIDTQTKHFEALDLPYNSLEGVFCDHESHRAIFIAASEHSSDAIVHWQNNRIETLKNSHSIDISQEEIACATTINFTNKRKETVQGFLYHPRNANYRGPENTLPPLIVICHGGPTASTRLSLNLKIQYWTNRGFAIFDINYSGSTGYGRTYRDRLKGQWGILDVEDICAGVEHLVKNKVIDPDKVVIRGSSAGGFTTLAALTSCDIFKAGTSLYGIGDLSILAEDTHKFESHYLDSLIGPYPKEKATYRDRSPLYHVHKLNCPVLFLQGQEDVVVPPNQAEAMIDALRQKNIPVAYVCYPEEGHGFRQAKNIRHALETEYAFYAYLFGLSSLKKLSDIPFVS